MELVSKFAKCPEPRNPIATFEYPGNNFCQIAYIGPNLDSASEDDLYFACVDKVARQTGTRFINWVERYVQVVYSGQDRNQITLYMGKLDSKSTLLTNMTVRFQLIGSDGQQVATTLEAHYAKMPNGDFQLQTICSQQDEAPSATTTNPDTLEVHDTQLGEFYKIVLKSKNINVLGIELLAYIKSLESTLNNYLETATDEVDIDILREWFDMVKDGVDYETLRQQIKLYIIKQKGLTNTPPQVRFAIAPELQAGMMKGQVNFIDPRNKSISSPVGNYLSRIFFKINGHAFAFFHDEKTIISQIARPDKTHIRFKNLYRIPKDTIATLWSPSSDWAELDPTQIIDMFTGSIQQET